MAFGYECAVCGCQETLHHDRYRAEGVCAEYVSPDPAGELMKWKIANAQEREIDRLKYRR